jgi:hypothetical protein
MWAQSPRAEPCSGQALGSRRGGARSCAQTRIDHRRLGVAQAVFAAAAYLLNDARGVYVDSRSDPSNAWR